MQANIALSRQLTAQASELRGSQLDVSLLLSMEALQKAPPQTKEEARFALLDTLTQPYHTSTQLTGHTYPVEKVAFSPNGKLLASASADKTVRLWDVATGSPRGQLLTGHTRWVVEVEFSPDGDVLASRGGGGGVRLWNIETKALASEACRIANRNLSRDEWSSFVGSEFDYARTCPNLPAGTSLLAGYGAEGLAGSLSRGVNVADVFDPAFQFEVGKRWESVPPEMIDQIWLETGPKGGSLLFTNPLYYVFDLSNPSVPKEVLAPKNAREWLSWFQRHPNLETSKPVPVSVGGASAMQIDVTASSTLENHRRYFCPPRKPCVPLYPTSGGPILAFPPDADAGKDRYVILDVRGETVIINITAPADKFDAFSPKAQEVLDSVEWKGGMHGVRPPAEPQPPADAQYR